MLQDDSWLDAEPNSDFTISVVEMSGKQFDNCHTVSYGSDGGWGSAGRLGGCLERWPKLHRDMRFPGLHFSSGYNWLFYGAILHYEMTRGVFDQQDPSSFPYVSLKLFE